MAELVRLAALDEATWGPELDYPPTYSPFNTRFADALDELHYEAVHLHADDVVVELDVEPTSISKDRTRLIANRSGPRTGRVRVTLERPGEPPMIYTMAGLHSSRQPGHALALRAITATLEGLRALDRWGVTQGRQYAGMLAIESSTPMGGSGSPVVRDEHWAREQLHELSGLPHDTPMGTLVRAARHVVTDGDQDARERFEAARAVLSGQEALREREEFDAWRVRRAFDDGGVR